MTFSPVQTIAHLIFMSVVVMPQVIYEIQVKMHTCGLACFDKRFVNVLDDLGLFRGRVRRVQQHVVHTMQQLELDPLRRHSQADALAGPDITDACHGMILAEQPGFALGHDGCVLGQWLGHVATIQVYFESVLVGLFRGPIAKKHQVFGVTTPLPDHAVRLVPHHTNFTSVGPTGSRTEQWQGLALNIPLQWLSLKLMHQSNVISIDSKNWDGIPECQNHVLPCNCSPMYGINLRHICQIPVTLPLSWTKTTIFCRSMLQEGWGIASRIFTCSHTNCQKH
mmetsp:Transcript_24663/g.55580  ORF Transcript_24663/g.55580 Transcript_24663/m.55580 type:complete len:280 (-) Transcript_24663:87-926(-)